MAEFKITDNDLAPLKGKVAIVTGASGGIGLATVKLLLHHGATVVSADLNSSPIANSQTHTFHQTDVTSWPALLSLFTGTKERHGRIDHVHANAGISGRANYIGETFDSEGNLQEPDRLVYDINLRACINTAYLGVYHMRHQEPAGGSIVLTASASSFQQFRMADYTTAKHGVLGWMRGMVPLLKSASIPIRVNAIGPSWTLTGLVPPPLADALGTHAQGPEVAARSVAVLMADESRQGNFIYSWEGRFLEIEQARLLLVAAELMRGTSDEQAGEQSSKDGEQAANMHDIENLFGMPAVQSLAEAAVK